MCSVSGAYVLDKESLPDLGAVVDYWGIRAGNTRKFVEDSAAAIAVNHLLENGNNRGHDTSGTVVRADNAFKVHRGEGYAQDVYCHDDPREHHRILKENYGTAATGHDRYTTSGDPRNKQPFVKDGVAVAHNGNYINDVQLRQTLESKDRAGKFPLDTTTDTELSAKSLAMANLPERTINEVVQYGMWSADIRFLGAFSNSMLIGESLVALRDPYGFWPLHMAKMDGLVVVNSEITPILKLAEIMGYRLKEGDVWEVPRGHMVELNRAGIMNPIRIFPEMPEMRHFFDFVYLRHHEDPEARAYRLAAGKLLAGIVRKDILMGAVPNSGLTYLTGAASTGIKVDPSLIRKIDDTRTFLESTQEKRDTLANEKYAFRDSYSGLPELGLFDDSAVRFTTQDRVILNLIARGAKGVHLYIGSAPQITPDFNGIYTPSKEEHGAYNLDTDEKRQKYVECRGHGVVFERGQLFDMINKGMPVSQIIGTSVARGMNILPDERRNYRPGRFSLTYLSIELMKQAFSEAGINPSNLFLGTMLKPYVGYPEELRPYAFIQERTRKLAA